jgi:hypothetical protein
MLARCHHSPNGSIHQKDLTKRSAHWSYSLAEEAVEDISQESLSLQDQPLTLISRRTR